MGRVYAVVEDAGKRVLLKITCDAEGCSEEVTPHPEIAQSGWRVYGTVEYGVETRHYYCPMHVPSR